MQVNRPLAIAGALVGIGCFLIGAIPWAEGPSSPGLLVIGFVLGTMFGHASLAGLWCALGPFPLVQRLPLSFCWLAIVVVAFGVHIRRPSNDASVLLVYGLVLLGQWLTVQAPVWLMAARFGLKTVREGCEDLEAGRDDWQFGIRQVLILTTIVGVVLGISRAMLGGLQFKALPREWGFVVFLAVMLLANCVSALLLAGATFFYRRSVSALIAVAIVLCAAFGELPLVRMMSPGPGLKQEFEILIAINSFQCVWIFIFLQLVKADGYMPVWRLSR